jgi:hypothetical protein
MSLPPPITFRKRKEGSKSYILIQVMDTSYRFKLEGVFCSYNFHGGSILTGKMCWENSLYVAQRHLCRNRQLGTSLVFSSSRLSSCHSYISEIKSGQPHHSFLPTLFSTHTLNPRSTENDVVPYFHRSRHVVVSLLAHASPTNLTAATSESLAQVITKRIVPKTAALTFDDGPYQYIQVRAIGIILIQTF